MHKIRRLIAVGSLSAVLAAGVSVATVQPSWARSSGFNDEYIYATTKAVNDMDANPALKLTLFPATVVLDTAFLPFAIIAGFVT